MDHPSESDALQPDELAEIVDRQHRQIKLMHEALRTAILEGAGMKQILECANALISATLLHFVSEENVRAVSSSKNLAAHQRLHDEIVASLKKISENIEQRKISAAMDLLKFLEGRLSYHLNVEDAELERELANWKYTSARRAGAAAPAHE